MTPATMATLRLAATVAHALPGVGLRLRDGGRTILEVSGAPCSSPSTMSPCAFRMAVARAHQLAHTAARSGSLRFLSSEDLALDLRVSSGDRIWPSGTYRVGVGDVHVHGFATTLAPRHCRRLITERADAVALPVGVGGVGLHRDAATDVTLVHAVTPVGLAVERHFVPAPITSYRDYAVHLSDPRTIFSGVDEDDLTFRRGVAGFFARGHHPAPAGADVLATLAGGQATTWIDRDTTAGTVFTHAGDLLGFADDGSTAALVVPQLLDWAVAEGRATCRA